MFFVVVFQCVFGDPQKLCKRTTAYIVQNFAFYTQLSRCYWINKTQIVFNLHKKVKENHYGTTQFFCDIEALNCLLRMEFEGDYKDIELTFDLIELPYYFFFTGAEDDMKLAIQWYEKHLETNNDPELEQKVAVFKMLEEGGSFDFDDEDDGNPSVDVQIAFVEKLAKAGNDEAQEILDNYHRANG